MIDRIKQLMEEKGLTSTQFADSIEVPRAIVSHILSGRNKPSLDVVIKIVETFRDVRMDWLLLGEGEMLKPLAAARVAKEPVKVLPENPSAPATIPTPPEKPVEKPIEKVQSADKPVADKKTAAPPARTVEKIIVFYTDKTFDSYGPA